MTIYQYLTACSTASNDLVASDNWIINLVLIIPDIQRYIGIVLKQVDFIIGLNSIYYRYG